MNFYQKNKKIIWFSAIVLGIIVIYRALQKKINPKLRKNKTLVVANNSMIDNGTGLSMPNSFSNMVQLIRNNVDIIEVSLQMTYDRVPIVFASTSLDDLTDGLGWVKNKSWDQISKLNFKKYPNEKIHKFSELTALIKQYKSDTILYISNATDSLISDMNAQELFKNVENNVLVKGSLPEKPVAVFNAKIMYMNTVSFSFVGKMTTLSKVNEVAQRSKECQFVRVQFSKDDTMVLNGKLSNALAKVGCRLWVDVFDSKLSIPSSFKGDNVQSWSQMVGLIKAGAIVTNKPLLLEQNLSTQTGFTAPEVVN